MWKEEYKDCLEYIGNYWQRVIYKPSHMRLRYKINNLPYELPYSDKLPFGEKRYIKNRDINPRSIKLPHYYFVPNDNKFTYIYYWDSFFMFKGLMGTKHEWLMSEMIENFIYLFKEFHIIPNFSAPGSMNRSQPPFFSSMIMDTYFKSLNPTNPYKPISGIQQKLQSLTMKNWLKRTIEFAKQEYEFVWIDKEGIYNHSVRNYPLSRYGDRDIGYSQSSELESGWDMTSRFYNRCDQFLPIDLNSYLYKYELDFAKASEILNNREEAKIWNEKAEKRKKAMQIMWDDEEGFFFDFGYTFEKISHYFSIASYTPLWAGLATAEQAKKALTHLNEFETPYGLTIGAERSLAKAIDLSKIQRRYHPAIKDIIRPKQWDYPNIWSPLEYLTVIGFLRYGFIDDAKRIMSNSVKTHARLFRKYKTFFEKINGKTGEPSKGYTYAMQEGFGWTNAVFFRYIEILDALDAKQQITVESDNATMPYTLKILH
jgi:alpha,alpha-trehalase